MQPGKGFLPKLIHHLFPQQCNICNSTVQGERAICSNCYESLPVNRHCCSSCALPLSFEDDAGSICGRCVRKQPEFDYCISPFIYEKDIIKLVHGLKFGEKILYSKLMGDLLVQKFEKELAVRGEEPDCLLPVPLHTRRLRERGFNQSIEIARQLARHKSIPLLSKTLSRCKHTSAQAGLRAGDRQRNIRGAFKLSEVINCSHVLIIDDVMTTGATVNELARVLKQNAVERVGVLSFARSPI